MPQEELQEREDQGIEKPINDFGVVMEPTALKADVVWMTHLFYTPTQSVQQERGETIDGVPNEVDNPVDNIEDDNSVHFDTTLPTAASGSSLRTGTM